MKKIIILALMSSLLISCATLRDLVGESAGQRPADQQANLDGEQTAVNTSPDVGSAAASSEPTYSSNEMGDSSQAPMEVQQAEQQAAHAEQMAEQRSTSELDAAAPESSASGSDGFYASTNTTPGMPTGEVEQVAAPEAPQMPTELPEKGASWDQAAANATPESSYEEPKYDKPAKKSSKKIAKKSKKEKIAKNSKKSKRQIASAKKSKKYAAKKSKADCKKIAKHSKKSNKKEIAMCKAEKRKVASVKSKKSGKLARAGGNSTYK